jgi:hypothetical protein
MKIASNCTIAQQKIQQQIHDDLNQRDNEAGPSKKRKPKQEQKDSKGKFKLPPISSLMDQKGQRSLSPLDIPFYFHHKYFGIEQSCLLEQQLRSEGKGKSTTAKPILTDRH